MLDVRTAGIDRRSISSSSLHLAAEGDCRTPGDAEVVAAIDAGQRRARGVDRNLAVAADDRHRVIAGVIPPFLVGVRSRAG